MADRVSSVRFRTGSWSRRVERILFRVPGAAEYMSDWREGVEPGRLALWDIEIGGAWRGALVWEVEDGPTLTVLAMACDAAGAAVTGEIARVFEGLARLTDAQRLRFWTRRAALRRLMERRFYTCRDEAPGAPWCMERTVCG